MTTKVTVLRVREWQKRFENNRTRDLKYMEWVPVPNKHDGDGYTELLDHPNGTGHYGAWMLIVQVASKCDKTEGGCGGRGTLLREGARPYDSASLARQTRGSEAMFKEAIPRLIAIGWLEAIPLETLGLTENPAPSCDNPAPSCDNPAPSCGEVPTERNGTERNGISELTPSTREVEANQSGAVSAKAEANPPNAFQPVEANPPAWEEVWAYAQTIGLAEWRARDWLDEMCTAGWRDYSNRAVVDWRAMLRRVKTKWESDGRPKGPPSNSKPYGNAKNNQPGHRNAGTTNDRQQGSYSAAAARKIAAGRVPNAGQPAT